MSERERQRETERDRERQRETERDRERQRETERDRERQREKEKEWERERKTRHVESKRKNKHAHLIKADREKKKTNKV